MKDKPRNTGQWTEARYRSFIISMLRRGTNRWGPKNETKKDARVERGIYLCASCGEKVPPTVKGEDGKRKTNISVDHIEPVIDPKKGFTTWDDYIERMFCEKDNLQLLCKSCHDNKTKQEKEIARNRKK